MSKIYDKIAMNRNRKVRFHIEQFESAMEVSQTCKNRTITDDRFHDQSQKSFDAWEGVESYAEALDLLAGGYQPTVELMRDVFKAAKEGVTTRFAFQNSVAGYAPIVPLALIGAPNSMISMTMKPIKAKVIDIYYDMTCSCGTESEEIIKAGQMLLGTIIELERQGYRFNLYAVQSYCESDSADMLVVKVKSATQPLDLKRISFPLTHTAFFRVIGFDWYSKVPGGTYRDAYGRAIKYQFGVKTCEEMFRQMFGKTAVFFSAAEIIGKDKEYIREAVSNGNSKA